MFKNENKNRQRKHVCVNEDTIRPLPNPIRLFRDKNSSGSPLTSSLALEGTKLRITVLRQKSLLGLPGNTPKLQ